MKAALVTGANRGLGLGLVKVLVSKGYTVFAGMRTVDGFTPIANVYPITLDVANDETIQNVAETINAQAGKLDLLINNAGLNKDTATDGHKELVSNLPDLDRAALLNMFNINSVSPLIITKYLAPLMTSDQCFIINISSQRASFSDPNTSANYGYRATKVALNMFTLASLFDLPQNIQTFAVHPGSVLTDMNEHGTISPEESATRILAILDNWDAKKNGRFLDNDGSLYPL